jgi:hypothetical protein
VTSEGDLPLFLACEMPETSLDAIFLLMKLYPDVVYHRTDHRTASLASDQGCQCIIM